MKEKKNEDAIVHKCIAVRASCIAVLVLVVFIIHEWMT